MKVKRVHLRQFKRFSNLEICDIPETVRLVLMAGPNGCGKSSVFDAFNVWRYGAAPPRRDGGGDGGSGGGGGGNTLTWDVAYHSKQSSDGSEDGPNVSLEIYNSPQLTFDRVKAIYLRSAYRNEPAFSINTLQKVTPSARESVLKRMIENDVRVSKNYQRLVAKGLEDVFEKEDARTTIGEFREKIIGDIRAATLDLFQDLELNSLGDPLTAGTFKFDKGDSRSFPYMNLSGGEKAAFDLISDLVIKRREFDDTIFCIDEPEAHINPNLQGKLLQKLYELIPPNCQLWIATHAIGMLRRARDIETENPGTVAFLDFGSADFDQPQQLRPMRPTRAFWEDALRVALDDLADLVAPNQAVICEGNHSGSAGKNTEHDAICYNRIFSDEFPETRFLSGGNCHDIEQDRLALVGAIKALAKGAKVIRLLDRDDRSEQQVSALSEQGIKVLPRRHLECFLFDDEVLCELCREKGKSEEADALIEAKAQSLQESVARGNPTDDLKSAAGAIYNHAKARLGLVQCGNDAKAFQRDTLAKLVKPNMQVYKELRKAIFQ